MSWHAAYRVRPEYGFAEKRPKPTKNVIKSDARILRDEFSRRHACKLGARRVLNDQDGETVLEYNDSFRPGAWKATVLQSWTSAWMM